MSTGHWPGSPPKQLTGAEVETMAEAIHHLEAENERLKIAVADKHNTAYINSLLDENEKMFRRLRAIDDVMVVLDAWAKPRPQGDKTGATLTIGLLAAYDAYVKVTE
jgi:hypothetical protein